MFHTIIKLAKFDPSIAEGTLKVYILNHQQQPRYTMLLSFTRASYKRKILRSRRHFLVSGNVLPGRKSKIRGVEVEVKV